MAVSRHSRKGVVRKHVKRHERKAFNRHAQKSVVKKY